MSKHETNSNESNAAVNKAVAELLEQLTAQECFSGLNALFAGYLRSEFANEKSHRGEATYTFECFRNLTLELMSLENGNRAAFLDNLKSS